MSFKETRPSKSSLGFVNIFGDESSLECWMIKESKQIYFLSKDENGYAYSRLKIKDVKKLISYLSKVCGVEK